jgi:hypothetical protein
MNCEKCGAPIQPGDSFCTSCGAPVPGQPVKAPPSGPAPRQATGVVLPPPAAPSSGEGRKQGFMGFIKSPLGIVIISVVGLAVVAGIVLGIVLGVRSSSRKKAEKNAFKYAGEANDKIESAYETLEDAALDMQSIDFSNPEQSREQFEEDEKQVDESKKELDEALASLEKIETDNLDEWWGEYTSLLTDACEGGKKAIGEFKKVMRSILSLGEFRAAINDGVVKFESFIDTMNAALGSQAAGLYTEAKGTAQAAMDYANQAGEQFDKARKAEPAADLDKFTGNVSAAVDAASIFQEACDAAVAGDISRHNELLDQFNAEKDKIVQDMTFDVEAQFGATVNEMAETIEEQFTTAEKKLKDAEELYRDNT